MITQILTKQELTIESAKETVKKLHKICKTRNINGNIMAFMHKQPVYYKTGVGYVHQEESYLVLAELEVENIADFREIESEIKQ